MERKTIIMEDDDQTVKDTIKYLIEYELKERRFFGYHLEFLSTGKEALDRMAVNQGKDLASSIFDGERNGEGPDGVGLVRVAVIDYGISPQDVTIFSGNADYYRPLVKPLGVEVLNKSECMKLIEKVMVSLARQNDSSPNKELF